MFLGSTLQNPMLHRAQVKGLLASGAFQGGFVSLMGRT